MGARAVHHSQKEDFEKDSNKTAADKGGYLDRARRRGVVRPILLRRRFLARRRLRRLQKATKMGRNTKRTSGNFEDESGRAKQNGGDAQQQQNTLFMTADLIPKFTGQDTNYPVTKWIQDIEDNGMIFQWTPLQQLLVARRSLSGTALLWLKSERPFRTWDELAEEILKEFPSTWDTKTVHELMSARTKKPSESCLDYLLVMKEMGKRGKLADYVVIKYIVDGIIDDESNKIMLYGIRTYTELKEKLKIYELVKSKVNKPQERPERANVQSSAGRAGVQSNADGGIRKYEESRPSTSGGGGDRREQPWRHQPQQNGMKRTMFGSVGETCSNVGEDGGVERMYECDGDMTAKERMTLTDDSSHQIMKINRREIQEIEQKTKEKRPKKIMLNGKETTALMDSGSDVNLIRQDVYDELKTPKYDDGVVLTGLGSAKVNSCGYCDVNLTIDGRDFGIETFYIVPRDAMPYRAIVGSEFLRTVFVVMDEGTAYVFPKSEKWMTKYNCFFSTVDLVGTVSSESLKEEVVRCFGGFLVCYLPQAMASLCGGEVNQVNFGFGFLIEANVVAGNITSL
ncbi:hypothetical protein NE865_08766 [Phthorimaea operculella]|nr:hypothetical protein NE865_08766 [Phthorimaea operculella]